MSAEAIARIKACMESCAGLDGHPLFQALAPLLCDPSLARQWIAEQTNALADGGTSLPVGYSDAVLQSLVLLDDGRAQLSLAIVSAADWQAHRAQQAGQQTVVGFADGWTRICLLHGGPAEVQQFTLHGEGPLRHAKVHSPRSINGGASLDLANATQAVRFSGIASDIVMLRLLVRDPETREAVECDAATGQVLRVRQAQSHEGRIQMMLSLLRALGSRHAVPVVADLLPGWPSHMRWHGVREALAMDSLAGLALLDSMANGDPDAALQDLARRTRTDLFARYPQLAAVG